MSRSKFVPLLRTLLPHLPNFAAKGRLLFMAPIDQILRGVYFDPSAFDNVTFYTTRFIIPLCVPSDHIYYTFGNRFDRKEKTLNWKTDMPDVTEELVDVIMREVVPFLSRRASLSDFLETIPSSDDPYVLQARGYCLARCGRIQEAIEALDRKLAKAPGEYEWEHKLDAQVRAFRAKLVDDPEAAHAQLMTWEAETARNLGLAKFHRHV